MKNIKKAFTLIEIIVAITIFSIIMISIIAIYIVSSDTSIKSDINRAMQENLKSVITEMSEDIIKHWISWVSNSISLDWCDLEWSKSWYKKWTILCSKSKNDYFLAQKDDISWEYKIADAEDCEAINKQCFIVVKKWDELLAPEPLTNSLVTIRDLKFHVTSFLWVNKVTITATFQPSIKWWVKANLVKETKIYFQTTISERPILTN